MHTLIQIMDALTARKPWMVHSLVLHARDPWLISVTAQHQEGGITTEIANGSSPVSLERAMDAASAGVVDMLLDVADKANERHELQTASLKPGQALGAAVDIAPTSFTYVELCTCGHADNEHKALERRIGAPEPCTECECLDFEPAPTLPGVGG